MDRKKILHIQLLPLLSGAQNVMLNLLQGLDPAEYDIHVACRPGGPLVEEVKKRGYTYHPLPLLVHDISPLDAIVLPQLVRLCRKYKFDIVHTHSSKPGLLGRIAARLARVPLVIHTGHGAPFFAGQSRLRRRFYMELERLGAGFCDKMAFVNDYHRRFYLKHKLIAPLKAFTIRNAISPQLKERIGQASAARGVVGEIVTIGSIARFTAAKNMVMSVIGAIRVCLARQDVRFVFSGDGELFHLCRRMVIVNKLQNRILLPGWQNDTAAQLAGFDAFLLYSGYEGLPLGIIEAMTSGLPIIVSDLPMLRELVDSSNGWLIPANDLDRLETELHNILDAKDSYRQKGIQSKIKAEELCSYENFLRGYLSLYEDDAT
jgi:glycosyltransferase involved in cell wall biosynthesis